MTVQLRRFRCAWCWRWLGPWRGNCPWFTRYPSLETHTHGRCEWWWDL